MMEIVDYDYFASNNQRCETFHPKKKKKKNQSKGQQNDGNCTL